MLSSTWILFALCVSAQFLEAFSFQLPQSAQKSIRSQRKLLLHQHEEHHDSGNSNVPAGEEALHSAMMARSIRKLRDNRGLMKEDKSIVGRSRINLLLTSERVTSRKIKAKTRGCSDEAITVPISANSIAEAKGKAISNLKERKITKTNRSNAIDLPYPCTVKALRVYQSKHGDLVMPRRYTIPEHEDYPREWHGLDLASTVYDMKWWQQHVKQKPERVEELNSMGFLWERLQPEWNLVLEALVSYRAVHGDAMVPVNFVVPYGNASWPEATWGIPLGNCVYRIRHRADFLRGSSAGSRRDQLDRLGFIWNVQENRFQIFYSALEHFARMEGGAVETSGRNTALRVPSSFVVPKADDWPKHLWGYQLGAKCTAVRQKQLYVKGNVNRQQQLETLRFQWKGNASLGWLEVMHAAAIYSQLHSRHLNVPYDFKVPAPPPFLDPKMRVDVRTAAADHDDVWPWPEHLWGLPLGQRLKDVRQKGAYLKGINGDGRRRQLDALGFNWTPKRGRPTRRV